MEQQLSFKVNRDVGKTFLKKIPGIGKEKYLNNVVTKRADSVEIYRSSFKEKYFEKDNLLEFTELNDSSEIKSARYLNVTGYAQDLYLIKFNFTYEISDSTESFDVPVTAAIYFSVKHNGQGETIGITPSYFGIVNIKKHLIDFETDLIIKKYKNEFYLKPHLRNKNKRDLLFMPIDFPEHPIPSASLLNIEKIVKLDPNKIGGTKPLVFYIHNIFHDTNALQFHYYKSIHLTP